MICLFYLLVLFIPTSTTNIHLSTCKLAPNVIPALDSFPPFSLWPRTCCFQYDVKWHVTDKIFYHIALFMVCWYAHIYKRTQSPHRNGINQLLASLSLCFSLSAAFSNLQPLTFQPLTWQQIAVRPVYPQFITFIVSLFLSYSLCSFHDCHTTQSSALRSIVVACFLSILYALTEHLPMMTPLWF